MHGNLSKPNKTLHSGERDVQEARSPATGVCGLCSAPTCRLSASNRWVKKAELIPWGELEPLYEAALSGSETGAPALSVCIALGSQLIKETLQLSDDETVEQICENPYLQKKPGGSLSGFWTCCMR